LMVKEGLINLDFADVRSIMSEMGKAMMGTGEATGERRAILAAEAAIANPLLDEVSMKGAKGLLISITGGNDLTLYEVDEAASRIRQEVDEDANIILGATFDQGLEGVIRVSVVATGIDKPAGASELNDQRVAAEAAERLRMQTAARQAEAAQAARPAAPAPAAAQESLYVAQSLSHAPAQAPIQAPQPAPAPAYASQPAPAYAPQAQAVEQVYAPHHPDVEIKRMAPPPSVYQEAPAAVRRPEAPTMVEPFVPPVAEQPLRAPRMPNIDELPLPGQNLIRASQQSAGAPETRRRTLLERLATFGMSRADELAGAPPAPHQLHHAPVQPAPIPQQHALQAPVHQAPAHQAPAMQAPAPQPPMGYAPPRAAPPAPVHAEYAKRPPAQRPAPAMDVNGRGYPRAEDDHLEIPAFLRRQSS
ncbi:MAG TPA: cell division protein FtsZ, partial [Rhodoblastus sp.]|nr:cell division protein FtsZ [Rhodoblastus sp.]